MILIIDNYDSFTYNLNQQVQILGKKTKVVFHDELSTRDVERMKPEKIIISPGPKRPKDSGISPRVVEKFYKTTPILGVCLGHELIGEMFGSKVVHAKKIMHGKTSEIYHDESTLFKNIKNPFKAARYHSLILDKVPNEFKLTAWTKEQEIMAIEHKIHPLYGIQFHPESFMTPEGNKIMKNFLNQ